MKNGGSRALDLEISKTPQYSALEAAGVRSPDTIVVSGKELLVETARRRGQRTFRTWSSGVSEQPGLRVGVTWSIGSGGANEIRTVGPTCPATLPKMLLAVA